MARAFAAAAGAHHHLFHLKACVLEATREALVGRGGPYCEHAARLQRAFSGDEAMRGIELIIVGADEAVGPVIDIEQTAS